MTTEHDIAQRWYDEKSRQMESILGKPHNTVMHSIIPYSVGGALDLYYYPNGLPGAAIATMELSELPNVGSTNAAYDRYEMVMFTRHALDLKSARNQDSAFGRAHIAIKDMLNVLARYSANAELNPFETCEFPTDMPEVGGKCVIFDMYGPPVRPVTAQFGLMVVIEIFRSEMEFAWKRGGGELMDLLKSKGTYPYSDMDRQPVG